METDDPEEEEIRTYFKYAKKTVFSTRKCLKCDTEFRSSGIKHRICQMCAIHNNRIHIEPNTLEYTQLRFYRGSKD